MIFDEYKQHYKRNENFVFPDYSGLNFSNINNTILDLFGIKYSGNSIEKKLVENIYGNRKVVFIYIDGVGYDSWMNYFNTCSVFQKMGIEGNVAPITAVFPSTTAAASNTINTGLQPLEHGLFEWRLFIEQYNMSIKSLPFIPVYQEDRQRFAELEADPAVLFHGKTFYSTLKENGIKSYIVSESSLMKSDYSKIMYDGAKEKKRYDFLSEGFIILKKLLKKAKENSYTFFYIENLDKMEHRYGPGSEEHLTAIKFLSLMFDSLLKSLSGEDISMIISSDHGFTPVNQKIYVNKIDEFFRKCQGKAIPETWSPRDMMLYVNDIDYVKKTLQDQLDGEAMVITAEEMLKMQLMGTGNLNNKYRSRIGDVLVLPYPGRTVWFKYNKDDIIKDRGMHGGLSPEEMLIPLVTLNLKNYKS
ncbi:MAG: alkaline phosphatase family protein [Ferroplasma sp.]